MKNFEKIYCPVCRSTQIKQMYSGIDRMNNSYLREHPCKLFLFRCFCCDLLFLGKIDYDLKKVHELYWRMLLDNLENSHSLENTKTPYFSLNDLEVYKKTGKLLEIGCGDGSFLNSMAKLGWQTQGVELSERAANLARNKYNLNIYNGPLEHAIKQIEDSSFDVVVMWGLLEHLENPSEVLRIAKLLLRKGGLLVIYTPNANSLFHRIARLINFLTFGLLKFPMDLIVMAMHPMYFTPKAIRWILKQNGFSIKKIEMADIDVDFVFKAFGNFLWSNKLLLGATKILQKISHLNSMNSHMIVFAESI